MVALRFIFEIFHGIFSDQDERFSLLTDSDSSEGLGPRELDRRTALVLLACWATLAHYGCGLVRMALPIPVFRLDNADA